MPGKIPPDFAARLAAPFDRLDIKWKTQTFIKSAKGPRVKLVPYVDARAIFDRLDEVAGLGMWKRTLKPDERGEFCLCRLSITLPTGRTVHQEGIGMPVNVQPYKSAASDATKRAAVAWGIGRYLYRVPQPFVPVLDGYPPDGDPYALRVLSKKDGIRGWVRHPELPAWALPGGAGRPGDRQRGPRPSTAEVHASATQETPETPAPTPASAAPQEAPSAPQEPAKWQGGMTSKAFAGRLLAAFQPHTDHRPELGVFFDFVEQRLGQSLGIDRPIPRPSAMNAAQLRWLFAQIEADPTEGMPRAVAAYLAYAATLG